METLTNNFYVHKIQPYKTKKHELLPFTFSIYHKPNQYRELCIPHPRVQLFLSNFYDKYKEIILYYCSISSFSIRKPVRVASSVYHKDRMHKEKHDSSNTDIEENGKEYRNSRSFFVYEDYSNIYKFYESYKFHRCEKKYNYLKRLDISDCFNSIYTHSISWATNGKIFVKENLQNMNGSFADEFDYYIRTANGNETNGIIIGPEFSRIFAEIILQAVDKKLELTLSKEFNLTNKVEYEIFRYVDDYFIFFNEPSCGDSIEANLQNLLKLYKLRLNVAKSKLYNKPIITEISRAKQQILGLLDNFIELKHKIEQDEEKIVGGSIYINSKNMITGFKTILRECEVEYTDVMNFTLAIVERRIDRVLEQYELIPEEKKPATELVRAFLSILDFTFFISSVSPKVNMTIRMCRIIKICNDRFTNREFGPEYRSLVCKNIFDNSVFILKKGRNDSFTQIETLYYLVAISELGKDYWLDSESLEEYFNFTRDAHAQLSQTNQRLNYFAYTVLLFYMKDKKRYTELRQFIEKEIVDYIVIKNKAVYKDAECSMLALDFISCPYVSDSSKHSLLQLGFDMSDLTRRENLINKTHHRGNRHHWFTTWDNFQLGEELDAKRSLDVY